MFAVFVCAGCGLSVPSVWLGWWRLSDLLRRQSERETGASSESEFRRLFLDNVVVLAKHIAQIEQQRESESPFAPDARREDAQL